MSRRRTTLQDIAKICGCSIMTVSLALRSNSSISEKRRAKILSVAKQLNYSPDPALSALANYRRTQSPKQSAIPLAWISNHHTRDFWNRNGHFDFVNQYFLGASQRAKEIGYHLEHFWLREPGMNPKRLSKILYSRGINGIMLAPQPKAFTRLKMDWDKFSSVTFGYSLTWPRLHMTSPNHYRSMKMIVRKLLSLGYRRMGLILDSIHDARVNHHYLAAYLIEQRRFPRKSQVPSLYIPTPSRAAQLKWFRTYRPEVVLTSLGETYEILRSEGLLIPQDVGLAALRVPNQSLARTDGITTGVDENLHAVGVAAVDLLVSLLHRNERGVPAIPTSILIDGKWIEGSTVHRINIDRLVGTS